MKKSARITIFIIALVIAVSTSQTGAQSLKAVMTEIEANKESAQSKSDRITAWEKGVRALSAFAEDHPEISEALYQKGRLLFYLERDDQARTAYHSTIKLDPNHVEAHFMLGVLEMYSGNLEKSKSSFTTVLKQDPKHIKAHFEIARILSKLNQTDEIPKHYRAILEIEPDHPGANHELAATLSDQGKRKQALPYFITASEQEPRNQFYLWNLAQCRQLLDLHKEALNDFLNYQKQSPEDWRAYEKIIQVNEAMDQAELTNKWIGKLTELKKNGAIPELTERPFFIRDQFTHGSFKIFALEYYKLTGERAVKYSFQIRKPDDPDYEFKISLGSYDPTNKLAHRLGEIEKGVRRYHLDGYAPTAHYTYAFFNGNPGYHEVKKWIEPVLNDKADILSSTTYPAIPDGATEEKPE